MEKTITEFKAQQAQSVHLLTQLSDFLQQARSVGVKVDAALQAKLENALQAVSDKKLKVALIGGFSEGKTTIAAAWMEKLDKSSMNISQQESSNQVKIYTVGDDIELIDTPGLFGFKEQVNAETNEIEKYKDITKKYVSEAHLVLYVMNSTNPIKESHREDLEWLFKTLNLFMYRIFSYNQLK
ncbi:50S ribosome-binding GTPase [Aeromonas media]|uniref:dynamin family protein n=1 Tax=Aeromonas media TaxID=651 RepID=UPI0019135C15|nr:dynamin family protein [Aeromonas media]QQQ14569.1 50S ribosome-binding GTPase [Aeromonas media]